jgi:hypothetical protein
LVGRDFEKQSAALRDRVEKVLGDAQVSPGSIA